MRYIPNKEILFRQQLKQYSDCTEIVFDLCIADMYMFSIITLFEMRIKITKYETTDHDLDGIDWSLKWNLQIGGAH